MSAQIKVISLLVISVLFVVSIAKAGEPKTTKIPDTANKPQVEPPLKINCNLGKENEIIEQELNYYDAELSKMGVGSFVEQSEMTNDSTKAEALELYLQLMMPIIQKEELENIELIEIL
jgi:hypothetical protein